jgi:hypothetical protein
MGDGGLPYAGQTLGHAFPVLAAAGAAGVEILAYGCRVSPRESSWPRPCPSFPGLSRGRRRQPLAKSGPKALIAGMNSRQETSTEWQGEARRIELHGPDAFEAMRKAGRLAADIIADRFEVKVLDDGWTAVTCDRSLSAQFEHTVGVTAEGVEIFTRSLVGLDAPPY